MKIKCQACHIFCLYIGLKNVSPAQKGSIWRKIRKRGCNFPHFSVKASTGSKSNFLSPHKIPRIPREYL
jgi:hypothetical protein